LPNMLFDRVGVCPYETKTNLGLNYILYRYTNKVFVRRKNDLTSHVAHYTREQKGSKWRMCPTAGFSAKYVHASAPSYATIAPRTMTAPSRD